MKRHLHLHNIDSSINIRNRKHFFDETFFNVIDTETKAYWLGFIIADGCISKGSDKWSYRLYIKDLNHLEKFLEDLGADYTIEIGFSKEHNNIKSTEIATVKINSTQLCKDLLVLGVNPNKSMNEIFPNIPETLYPHLIRGYFDGDGSIYNSRRSVLEWHFSILDGFNYLINLSNKLPVKCNIYFKHKSNTGDILYNLLINKSLNISLMYKYLYKDATVFLSRKKDKFDKFIYIYNTRETASI